MLSEEPRCLQVHSEVDAFLAILLLGGAKGRLDIVSDLRGDMQCKQVGFEYQTAELRKACLCTARMSHADVRCFKHHGSYQWCVLLSSWNMLRHDSPARVQCS